MGLKSTQLQRFFGAITESKAEFTTKLRLI